MPSIRSLLSSNSGFTVAELLVTAFLGLLVMSIALSSSITQRRLLRKDTVRTRINQNLRGSLDLLGTDARVAGENLSSSFPAIEVIAGTGSAPDEIRLRRNLQAEVLPLCTQVNASSTVTQLYFAVPGNTPGCAYSGQTQSFNAWQAFRLDDDDDRVDAFLYDSATKAGEFFQYVGEVDGTTSYALQTAIHTWSRQYSVGSSAIYLLEEWHYRLVGDELELIINHDTANPLKVSFGVSDFQILVQMQDGSTKSSFTTADSWTQIGTLNVTLQSIESFANRDMQRTFSARFFPRNILSN